MKIFIFGLGFHHHGTAFGFDPNKRQPDSVAVPRTLSSEMSNSKTDADGFFLRGHKQQRTEIV